MRCVRCHAKRDLLMVVIRSLSGCSLICSIAAVILMLLLKAVRWFSIALVNYVMKR